MKDNLFDEILENKATSEVKEVDKDVEELKKASELLAKAATDKENRSNILKEVESVFSRVRLSDFPELAESKAVQSFLRMMGNDDLKPGETKNKGTLAEREREWTMADVHEMVKSGKFKLHKFTPYKSMPLTFNGLTMYVLGGEECELPDCFYDIYKDHIKAIKMADQRVNYLLGQTDIPPLGIEPTPEEGAIRAWSKSGKNGTSSGSVGTGRIIEELPSEQS